MDERALASVYEDLAAALDLSEWGLALELRHYGPGKHKSGTDQDVHGNPSAEDIAEAADEALLDDDTLIRLTTAADLIAEKAKEFRQQGGKVVEDPDNEWRDAARVHMDTIAEMLPELFDDRGWDYTRSNLGYSYRINVAVVGEFGDTDLDVLAGEIAGSHTFTTRDGFYDAWGEWHDDDRGHGVFGSTGVIDGTGSSLWAVFVQQAAREGQGITISPIEDAKPFWSKMGFGNQGAYEWHLNPAEVRYLARLLKRRRVRVPIVPAGDVNAEDWLKVMMDLHTYSPGSHPVRAPLESEGGVPWDPDDSRNRERIIAALLRAREINRTLVAISREFKESEHPRDKKGKFRDKPDEDVALTEPIWEDEEIGPDDPDAEATLAALIEYAQTLPEPPTNEEKVANPDLMLNGEHIGVLDASSGQPVWVDVWKNDAGEAFRQVGGSHMPLEEWVKGSNNGWELVNPALWRGIEEMSKYLTNADIRAEEYDWGNQRAVRVSAYAIEEINDGLRAVTQRFPMVADQELNVVFSLALDSSTWGDATKAEPFGDEPARMRFNVALMNLAGSEASMRECVANGFHPPMSDSWANVARHEFGHLVHYSYLNEVRDWTDNHFGYPTPNGTTMNPPTWYRWGSNEDMVRFETPPSQFVSRYARKNVYENFAEMFDYYGPGGYGRPGVGPHNSVSIASHMSFIEFLNELIEKERTR